jgi:Spy/CpxP family protein refolding chaperone
MKLALLALATLMLGASTNVRAQQPGGQDPIGANLYPPDLVMQHQQEIGLTDEQRSYITGEIQQAQKRATDLQWQLQREVESMTELLRQNTVDEARTIAQLDRVLAAEREIKRIQLTLVVRIRNRLTPDQRTRLTALRGATHE